MKKHVFHPISIGVFVIIALLNLIAYVALYNESPNPDELLEVVLKVTLYSGVVIMQIDIWCVYYRFESIMTEEDKDILSRILRLDSLSTFTATFLAGPIGGLIASAIFQAYLNRLDRLFGKKYDRHDQTRDTIV